MKKTIINLVIVISIMICFKTVKSQTTTSWNIWGFSTFLGYQPATSGILGIGTGDPSPINFYTNGAVLYPFPVTTQRMTIYDAVGGPFNTGYVGIGKVIPPYNLTVAQHISIDTNIVYPNVGNGYIGCYMIGDTTILHNYGVCNVFGGYLSGVGITTGTHNAFFGHNSGFSNTTGYGNSFLGFNAGLNNTAGSFNTFLGNNAAGLLPDLTNASAIGSNAKVGASNCMVLGDGTINVGIGTSKPQTTLDVNGTISANQILINNQDLLALVLQLQSEVKELKQQLMVMKN
ncbi:MAG: hypothetical protein WCL14_10440 [Bacteroidota bacterium]